MSGQSAALSLRAARAMQEEVQVGGNHSQTNGGSVAGTTPKAKRHAEEDCQSSSVTGGHPMTHKYGHASMDGHKSGGKK